MEQLSTWVETEVQRKTVSKGQPPLVLSLLRPRALSVKVVDPTSAAVNCLHVVEK